MKCHQKAIRTGNSPLPIATPPPALFIVCCWPSRLHGYFKRLFDLLLNLLALLLRSCTRWGCRYRNLTSFLGIDVDRRDSGKLLFGQRANHSRHNEKTQDTKNYSHGRFFTS